MLVACNMISEEEKKIITANFKAAVNMKPAELSKWLETDESKRVGWRSSPDDTESVGHKSGHRIIQILKAKPDQLQDEDFAHMRKVVGYVKRHSAQEPDRDVTNTKWRYSLMNWGHDPCK